MMSIADYSDLVRACLDVLGKAPPSEGMRNCSRDCKDASEQIQNGQAAPAAGSDDDSG